MYEFSRQLRHTISSKVRPPILNREVLTFNEAYFGQALAKCISQKIEIAARSFIVKTLQKLGITDEPIKAVGHPTRGVGWTPPR